MGCGLCARGSRCLKLSVPFSFIYTYVASLVIAWHKEKQKEKMLLKFQRAAGKCKSRGNFQRWFDILSLEICGVKGRRKNRGKYSVPILTESCVWLANVLLTLWDWCLPYSQRRSIVALSVYVNIIQSAKIFKQCAMCL